MHPTNPKPSIVTPARGYAFQEDLLYRAEARGLRVVEVPITFTERRAGQSKLRWRDVTEFFATILRLRRSGVLPHPSGTVTWGRLPRHERRFAIMIGVALVILTGIPYLYGWLRTPAGYTYTGIHSLAAGDMAVYASHLEQVREGRWCFLDLYTSEQSQRCTVNIFWLAAGTVARAIGLSGPLAFHVLRLALIVPFTMFLAVFVAAFLRAPIGGWPASAVRRTALLLLAFSAGVGAYLVPTITAVAPNTPLHGYWPFDLGVPEAITFLTLYQTPHFIASVWLLLYIILSTLRFQQRSGNEDVMSAARGAAHSSGPLTTERTWSRLNFSKKIWAGSEGGKGASERAGRAGDPEEVRPTSARRSTYRYSIAAGIAALILIQFHPFYAPTVAAVLIVWTIVESIAARRVNLRALTHTLIVGIFTVPSVAYHLILLRTDPITAAIAQQNLLPTPPVWVAIVSYGALVPLAIAGCWMHLRMRTASSRLLIVWFCATAFLIYLPFPWQRRLTEGLHIAMVIAATPALLVALAWMHRRLPTATARYAWTPLTAVVVFVPIFAFSPLVNLLDDIALYTLRFPKTIPAHTFYYPTTAVDAMRWIRDHAAPADPVFALGVTGNFLPMYANRASVVGHGVLTTNYWEKLRAAEAIANGTASTESTNAFLARERVRYVLITDADRPRWTINPVQLPNLRLVYQNSGAEVYERIVP